MRIAFVGLPLAALLLSHDGHTVVWAGICRKGAIGTRRLVRRLGKNKVRIVPTLESCIDEVRAEKPDLVVSWFWTKRIPREFREVAPHGAIGVHPSLLPRHRGPDPFFWTIDGGDETAGVTAHVLDDAYDTGAVLGQRTLGVDPSWTAWRLAKKLDRPSLALLRDTVRAYANGMPPSPQAQREEDATLAPEPTEDELEIRWTEPSARIERRVRAASPWPGTFSAIGATVITLTRVRPTTDFPRALDPGEAFVRKDGVAVVRSADTALELLAGRTEDDDRELDVAGLADVVTRAAH